MATRPRGRSWQFAAAWRGAIHDGELKKRGRGKNWDDRASERVNTMSTRETIVGLIEETLKQSGKSAGAMADQDSLFAGGVGLDSLDFATLVVRLEQTTGYDPFRDGDVQRLPRSLGELVGIYEGKSRQSGQ